MVIPPWIINPYGDIEETNVIIQEELTELSTNEELKDILAIAKQIFSPAEIE
ncbi:unnamed protein product [Acanthoscelides obtectus]|uniref:Uncharacterized protein n=1 Tax=Acanthoscelides obtectus TaxID=200917 RepID=A0A9P0MMX3_ACAOB|nr:unnamed protein product [Acanthoscelides obtectus]CAK1630153.1 hypothetical protein AOBTE_LOCUS6179 [Acanthoscelides obtectus]